MFDDHRSRVRAFACAALLGAGACQRPSSPAETGAAAERAAVEAAPASVPTAAAPAPIGAEELAQLLGPAQRVAVGDLDGSGHAELVVVDLEALRVVDASGRERARVPAPGGVQVLRVADLDGDGRAEILAGWGRTRDHRDAPARASLYRLDGDSLVEQIVMQPASERPEIVELAPVAGSARLLVAHFQSKYMVELAYAEPAGERWTFTPIATLRMATSFALADLDGDGADDLVVGRIYGDEPEADGDAFVLRPDGTRVPIPIVGGVRSLTVADLDGDGQLELLIGDGWNRDYGKVARARLTRAWWDAGEFRSELLEDAAGQYTLWDILAVDLDGDGEPELVTRGSSAVRVLRRGAEGWVGRTVAAGCREVFTIEFEGRPELLGVCEAGNLVLEP
jgi:hypothetical protein